MDDIVDLTGQVIAFENGELDEDEVIELFQALLDSGVVWQLQGSYGRTATALLDAGLITRADRRRFCVSLGYDEDGAFWLLEAPLDRSARAWFRNRYREALAAALAHGPVTAEERHEAKIAVFNEYVS